MAADSHGININQAAPLIEAVDVHKSFGLNEVLKGISLSLNSSEVIALIGGNGAGKSTLMKIIMGIYRPDSGTFRIGGTEVSGLTPARAMRAGVYMVPQEPMIFPHMSVEDNVLMGFTGHKRDLRQQLDEVYARIDCKIDRRRLGMTLSIAEQQMVELLRGLMRKSRVLILDEPTSSLTFDEVNILFKIMRDLKASGIGIIYITHRMAEVFEIADSICIMSDGRITLRGPAKDFTRQMLVEALLPPGARTAAASGTKARAPAGSAPAAGAPHPDPVLSLRDFCGYGFADVSFDVYPGEIVGVAGVVGAGRTELATTIFGMEQPLGGRVLLDGTDITGLPTHEIIGHGINYVPEDRRLNGLFGISSAAANISSSVLGRADLGGFFLKQSAENALADRYIADFRIKVTSRDQEAGSLSGGNQQKLIIARAFSTSPRLVILDEPTRGIDAAARGDVYAIIRELRASGVSILVISSDMEEIIELSDRAVVFCRGRISAVLRREQITQQNLTSASFGITQEAHDAD